MASGSRPGERRHLGMARMAVSVFFFLNGVMSAALSTRLPALQLKLALLPDQLGLALLGCTIGGLAATIIAARLSRRFGSRMITIIGAICMGGALLSTAWAPTFLILIVALVFFGAGGGALDISMNTQATDVERGFGRSMLNSFYSCFSVGSLMSALFGSMLAAFDVRPEFHFLAIAIIASVGIAWSLRFLLPSEPLPAIPREQEQSGRKLALSRPLILLGVIAFCALLSVGAMFDWSAVYLSTTLHTGAGWAAAGFATFLACMALGRSVGDRMAMRFGKARLLRCACLLAALGLTLALLLPWAPVALVGLGLAGIGLAVPFPLVISAAGRLSTHDRGSALATITTWGYGGMIAGPAVIGFVANRVELRVALALVVLLCVLAAFCAPVVGIPAGKDSHTVFAK